MCNYLVSTLILNNFCEASSSKKLLVIIVHSKMADSVNGRGHCRCCRCASNGSCVRCSCVISGRKCVDCYPSKKDQCLNLNPTRSAPSAHVDENDHPPSSDPDPDHEALNVVNSDEPVSGAELNSEFKLPAYKPATTARFMWGALDSTEVSQKLDLVYNKVVHWKKNLFKIPTGSSGQSFTKELSRLYLAFAEGSALESIALQAAIIFPSLMLQKPHHCSKVKEHRAALVSRLDLWRNGDFMALLHEGSAIQSILNKYHEKKNREAAPTSLSREFANQMFQGKTKLALHLLSSNGKSGIWNLNEQITINDKTTTVRQILKEKHTSA